MYVILNRLQYFHSHFTFPPFLVYPLLRGPLFLDPIPPYFLYIKPLFPINKQFSNWFFSWLGRSSLGFLLTAFIPTMLTVSATRSTPPDAPDSLILLGWSFPNTFGIWLFDTYLVSHWFLLRHNIIFCREMNFRCFNNLYLEWKISFVVINNQSFWDLHILETTCLKFSVDSILDKKACQKLKLIRS